MSDKPLQERYDDCLQVVSWQARRIETLESIIEAAAQMLKFPAQERLEQREPAPIQWVPVIEVEKDQFFSKSSRSHRDMWRLRTTDGRQVNLFDHSDPLRDQKQLLEESDYWELFRMMDMSQVDLWTAHPIEVELVADGSFWKVTRINRRPDGAAPDEAAPHDDELDDPFWPVAGDPDDSEDES